MRKTIAKPAAFWIIATSLLHATTGERVGAQWEGRQEQLAAVEKAFDDPPEARRLTPEERVWIDRQKHRLIVDGYVAIQDGPLEMFACPVFTKEHESIVALFCKALTVHAGLLALGAEVGKPVRWEPEYQPPSGSEIQIEVQWLDAEGKKQSADARTWIRQAGEQKKILEPNWVFAGSGFWQDPETKKKYYMAEAGDLICVSNFSTATLDIPIESTQANAGLLFFAHAERVPRPGTPIRLVLQVVQPKESGKNSQVTGESAAGNQPQTSEVDPGKP